MTTAQLERYAELVLFGVGSVKGQNVVIQLELPGLELARALAELCYQRGARLVEYLFQDNYLKKARILHGGEDALGALSPWTAEMMKRFADGSWTRINIRASEDDFINRELPADRSAVYAKALAGVSGNLRRKSLTFRIPWIIVLVPTREKAREAFPNLDVEEAFRRYENGIINVLKLDDDPLAYWQRSFAELDRRKRRFNELGLTSLRFRDGDSDLSMDLIPGGSWATAEQRLPDGSPVRVNIPSCEIYTSPRREGVNGRITVTKPFIPVRIPGEVIRGAWFEFREGKAVDFGAESGRETLKALVEMDDNAGYLGEVALVDRSSPVAAQNFLFHSILYDENAASHIAIGGGFPSLVEGMSEASESELIAAGINQSIQHQDMMIGSTTMEVTGVDRFGKEILLMKDGSFVEA